MAVTDIADTAGATTAGYANSTTVLTSQGQLTTVGSYTKLTTPPLAAAPVVFGGYGQVPGGDAAAATAALAKALISLNNNRRHRYAGSPGVASGAANVSNMHGDALTVDVN